MGRYTSNQASGMMLDRAEVLSISGGGTGGTIVTADLTISPVTPGKCVLIPMGGVSCNGLNATPVVFTLSMVNSTTVRLQFKMPGTGGLSYQFYFSLLSFL